MEHSQVEDHEFPTDHNDLVLMSSYPRSGNTMLRSTIEGLTGIATGSDADVQSKLVLELMEKGLVGEGLFDRRIWVCKTHFPERAGPARKACDRAILLIRSPMDAILSLFHMTGSSTHDCSITKDDIKKFSDLFTEWINQEA